MRTAFDFSSLYRSTVGFDRLFNLLDSTMGAAEATSANWPPYNIERLGEDQYRITMAVAGFAPDEIELVQQENALVVAGRKHPEPEGVQVLHRGIANRAFRQTFNLADYVKVSGANLENGLLVIDLVREVPEAMRPRRIEIAGGGEGKTIEHDAKPKVEKAKAA
jgi:molecular chaperone IbpA